MPWIRRLLPGAAPLAACLAVGAALADDPRCAHPPYGGSPDKYRAFLNTFDKTLDDPGKVLSQTCEMKFGGADRAPLHKLGITDEEIDAKATSDLASYAIEKTKKP